MQKILTHLYSSLIHHTYYLLSNSTVELQTEPPEMLSQLIRIYCIISPPAGILSHNSDCNPSSAPHTHSYSDGADGVPSSRLCPPRRARTRTRRAEISPQGSPSPPDLLNTTAPPPGKAKTPPYCPCSSHLLSDLLILCSIASAVKMDWDGLCMYFCQCSLVGMTPWIFIVSLFDIQRQRDRETGSSLPGHTWQPPTLPISTGSLSLVMSVSLPYRLNTPTEW